MDLRQFRQGPIENVEICVLLNWNPIRLGGTVKWQTEIRHGIEAKGEMSHNATYHRLNCTSTIEINRVVRPSCKRSNASLSPRRKPNPI